MSPFYTPGTAYVPTPMGLWNRCAMHQGYGLMEVVNGGLPMRILVELSSVKSSWRVAAWFAAVLPVRPFKAHILCVEHQALQAIQMETTES